MSVDFHRITINVGTQHTHRSLRRFERDSSLMRVFACAHSTTTVLQCIQADGEKIILGSFRQPMCQLSYYKIFSSPLGTLLQARKYPVIWQIRQLDLAWKIVSFFSYQTVVPAKVHTLSRASIGFTFAHLVIVGFVQHFF